MLLLQGDSPWLFSNPWLTLRKHRSPPRCGVNLAKIVSEVPPTSGVLWLCTGEQRERHDRALWRLRRRRDALMPRRAAGASGDRQDPLCPIFFQQTEPFPPVTQSLLTRERYSLGSETGKHCRYWEMSLATLKRAMLSWSGGVSGSRAGPHQAKSEPALEAGRGMWSRGLELQILNSRCCSFLCRYH